MRVTPNEHARCAVSRNEGNGGDCMPRAQKPWTPDPARLAQLPKDPGLTLVGGRRTLPAEIQEGKQAFRPQLVLWFDERQEYIRRHEVVNPLAASDGGVSAALRELAAACEAPFPMPPRPGGSRVRKSQPALPGKMLVNDEELAQAARTLFEPLGVHVEYAQTVPLFDEAFTQLSSLMGDGVAPSPVEPFSWNVEPALLAPLYQAAAAFWRRHPWEYMPDMPPVIVELGEHGPAPNVATLYASILGGAGELAGVAFYYSREALERFARHGLELLEHTDVSDEDVEAMMDILRTMGAADAGLSPDEVRDIATQALVQGQMSDEEAKGLIEDGLTVFYTPLEESDPSYLSWLAERELKYPAKRGIPSFQRTIHGGEARQPDARETRALTSALEAMCQFFSRYRFALEAGMAFPDGYAHAAVIKDGAAAHQVTVRYTPPEPEWMDEEAEEEEAEEPLPAATEEGMATLYRFHVALAWKPDVWRRIELRGDQTLDELHEAIQEAFNWDNDHLYSFFLSGEAWDTETEYVSPYADDGHHANAYRLEHLPLKAGQTILYLFDYGDELEHIVKLEAVLPGAVEKRKKYPRITERGGRSVPQYSAGDR